MKHLKMLGLAMVATATATVFAAAGSAQATVLCTLRDTPACETFLDYSEGTNIQFTQASGASIRLTSGATTVTTCTGTNMKGRTTNTGSSSGPVDFQIEELTWTGCSETVDTIFNGTLSFRWIKGTYSAIVEASFTQWTMTISGNSCTYGFGEASTHVGTLTGGEEPTLNIEAIVKKQAGAAGCPAEVGFDAALVVTEPHALFVVEKTGEGSVIEEGILCKSTLTPCTDPYGKGTTLNADLTGSVAFEHGGTPIATCSGGTLKAKTANAGSNVEPVTATVEALTWSGCSQTTTTVAKGSLEVRRIEGTEDGTLMGKNTQITLGVSGTSCTYGFGEESDLGTLTGGEAPLIDISTEIPKTAGGFTCPASVQMMAEYKVTEPAPLYVEETGEAGILCESTTTPCGSPYGKETKVDADIAGSSIFETLGGTTLSKCTGTLRGNVPSLGAGAEAVTVALEELTWSECSRLTATVALGELEIERIEGTENGTAIVSGTEVKALTIFGSCTYGFGEGIHGGFTGGEEPMLNFNSTVEKTAGSAICPATVRWTGSYKFTQPAPLYLEPA